MSTYLNRIRRAWSDHVVGPTLRTYDAACEELGGAPWRPLPEATDSWFLARPESANGSATLPALDTMLPALDTRLPALDTRLPPLDTGALVLKRGMSDRAKLTLLGGGALVVIASCLISLTGGTAHSSTTPPAAVLPPAPAPPPATPAAPSAAPIKIAQAPTVPKASPSVRALFGPAPSRPHAVAAKRHPKRHRR